ncbi:MAG: cell envelope biogenesis protein LolA [Alphaproteobacteria bacterium]|nr:cell envelope biogenesis protein LolA [Alphaproteobacteria bacterium]
MPYRHFAKFTFALGLAALAATQALAQGAPIDLKPKTAPASRAIQKVAPPPRVSNQNSAETLRAANAYFNSIRTMVAGFTQEGADGRQTRGKLYLQKPGRLRFVYDRPSPIDIVADGTSVAIRNRRTAKQDLYYISQTPLKFLLKQNIDLSKDTKILDIRQEGAFAMIRIEDRATFGGTSRIKLYFNQQPFTLSHWVVSDPQGYETRVNLAAIDLKTRPDAGLFKINYERQE